MEILQQHHERWPDPHKGPLEVCITVALVDGRPEAVGVEMWGVHPVNLPKDWTGMTPQAARKKWQLTEDDSPASGIRTIDLRLPLAQMVDRVVESARKSASIATGAAAVSNRVVPADSWIRRQDVQKEAKRVLDLTEPKRRGRRPLPRSHYEDVAAVYSAARRDGLDPTQAVREHWVVSKTQAAKWIYRCRRDPLNLLPPTDRGRPAGDPDLAVTNKPRRTKQGGNKR